MKRAYVLLLLILVCSELRTQTFSTVYDNPFLEVGGSTGYNVFLHEDSLVITGNIAVQSTEGTTEAFFQKYNLEGDLQYMKLYDPEDSLLNSSVGFWDGMDYFQSSDTSFYTCAMAEFINFGDSVIEKDLLFFLDDFGQEISRSQIDWHPDGKQLIGARSVSIDEHLVYGVAWDNPGVASLLDNGFVLSANSLGEVNWSHRYDSILQVFFLDVFPDNSLVLGATIKFPFNEEPVGHGSDQVVIKTDAEGNEQWRHIYGSIATDSRSPVSITSDGKIICLGTKNNSDIPNRGELWWQLIEDNGDSYEVMAENFLLEGNFIQKVQPFGVKQVLDGGFIGYGFGYELYDETIPDVPERAFIYKVDENLDSLWGRYYGVYNTEVDSENYFYDMVEGPDSCLYLTGAAERGEGTGLYGLSKTWLIKLDKHGCLEPGCHLIEEDSANHITQIIGLQNSLKVFPNPVRDRFTLEINLPPEFSPPSGSVLKLLDINGREVKQIELSNMSHSHTEKIDVSDLPTGTYTLHWMNTGLWYDSVKVVVE